MATTPSCSADDNDYYALLCIPRDAALEDIKTAYRALALKYHPDKNHDEHATATFQRLARAWDTLRDEGKRRAYDCERGFFGSWDGRSAGYGGGDGGGEGQGGPDINWDHHQRARQHQHDLAEARHLSFLASQRRAEIDQAVMASWWATCSGAPSYTVSGQRIFPDEAGRRQRARVWKEGVREDYFLRLQAWLDARGRLLGLWKDVRGTMARREEDLRAVARKEDQSGDVVRVLSWIQGSMAAAHRRRASSVSIAISEACSAPPSHADQALDPELQESPAYKLIHAIGLCRKRARQLIHDISLSRRQYEEEEARIRQLRVDEALDLLGPREINPPLFCAVDRRGRAINQWRALGRVGVGRACGSLEGVEEGAWHFTPRTKLSERTQDAREVDGRNEHHHHHYYHHHEYERDPEDDWNPIDAEQSSCGRCARVSIWHILRGMQPRACPGCGLIVCSDCARELALLREYERWLSSSSGYSCPLPLQGELELGVGCPMSMTREQEQEQEQEQASTRTSTKTSLSLFELDFDWNESGLS